MYSSALITQRNKRNFSTITSRVSASQRTRNCRCRNLGKTWLSTDMKVQWRSPPDGYCRHNSHDDTTDETVTTWLADHRPSHQLKESPHTASRIKERLSHEIRCRTIRQYNSFMNECLRDLHTSFTQEDDVCSQTTLPRLTQPDKTVRRRLPCPNSARSPSDRPARARDQWSVTDRDKTETKNYETETETSQFSCMWKWNKLVCCFAMYFWWSILIDCVVVCPAIQLLVIFHVFLFFFSFR